MPDPSPGDAYRWPSPAQDQADFPAVFPAEGGTLILQATVSIVFAGGGLVGLFYLIRLSPTLTALNDALIGLACLGLAGIGAICIAETFRSHLVIFEDAIEQHDLITTRRLPRRAIASKAYGWSGANGDDSTLTLFPISKQTKPLKIPVTFKRTAAWNAWMSKIPDGVPPAWQQRRAERVASTLARWT